MVEPRVLLLVAERVHSFAPAADTARADAVLVSDGRIAAVGRAADLESALPASSIIELPGTTLTPGLTDAHIHLTEWALGRRQVDLTGAHTPEQVADDVARHARQHPDTAWIRGFGWNAHHWGGAYPDRAVLDAALPDRPVVLQSHDMHALWVNGPALERAGITHATADPADGRIVRDADGRATGVLLEYAARLVTAAIPAPAVNDVVDAVDEAQPVLHRLGITGVHSFPGIHVREPEPLLVLQTLRAEQRLRLRTLQQIPLELLDAAIGMGVQSGSGDDFIRIGGVKMFLDGSLGSRTAWMRAPYEGSDDVGVSVLAPDLFEHHVMRAAAAGLSSTVHAIGDAAVALALDVLARAARPAAAVPHRIEHIQCCPPERFGDAGRHGILCSVQPAHLISDWMAADRHWGARARGTYAFHSLAAGGAVLAFGSDAPVEPVDPRLGLFAALARQDLNGAPDGGWQAGERIDACSALRAYTRGPAIAAGLGDRLGMIAPGAHADIVAWDRDPLATPAHDLLAMRCVAAVVGGTLVWRDT